MRALLTIPSAEPFFFPGGKIGCLLVHGFTGTPKEMRMLADSLIEENFTVLGIRLAGHATQPEDMVRSRYQDWISSVEDGINLLKGCTDQQIIMGLSMGGILSLIAAARYDLKAVVSFSTPCSLPDDPRAKFLPLLAGVIPYINKGKPDWRNLEAQKDHVDYPFYPTRSILELKKLLEVMNSELPNVKIPALFFQSKRDEGIPARSMDFLYDAINSKDKTKLWVDNSGHVVIREPEREIIFTEVKKFVKRVTRN
jgi:carboxylesterase